MEKFLMHHGVRVMEGTKTHELLTSKDPNDRKLADRLASYCNKAENASYEVNAIAKLRKEYSDVL